MMRDLVSGVPPSVLVPAASLGSVVVDLLTVPPAPAPLTWRGYSPLRYQRLLRGWSQQDLADELYARCAAAGKPDVGIGPAAVSRWELGQRKPGPLYRKHLCQLFGLTAEQLGWM